MCGGGQRKGQAGLGAKTTQSRGKTTTTAHSHSLEPMATLTGRAQELRGGQEGQQAWGPGSHRALEAGNVTEH